MPLLLTPFVPQGGPNISFAISALVLTHFILLDLCKLAPKYTQRIFLRVGVRLLARYYLQNNQTRSRRRTIKQGQEGERSNKDKKANVNPKEYAQEGVH